MTFEDLESWQKARQTTRAIYALTRKAYLSRDFGLCGQLQRAGTSVMSNIAEGFERGGDREFQQFLAVAKGSVGELRSQLYVALDTGMVREDDFESIRLLAEQVRPMMTSSQ